MVFHNGFKLDKNIIDIEFMLKWLELNVFYLMIKKYNVIFKAIM